VTTDDLRLRELDRAATGGIEAEGVFNEVGQAILVEVEGIGSVATVGRAAEIRKPPIFNRSGFHKVEDRNGKRFGKDSARAVIDLKERIAASFDGVVGAGTDALGERALRTDAGAFRQAVLKCGRHGRLKSTCPRDGSRREPLRVAPRISILGGRRTSDPPIPEVSVSAVDRWADEP
jgi:hypothetical protein